jgi:hypothetical protein
MGFRLSLRYQNNELCARELETDDEVVALVSCRHFQAEVLPVIKQLPHFRKVTDSDIERRIDRIDLQTTLFPSNGTGHHA